MIGTDRALGRTVGVIASLTIHVAVAIAMWTGQPVVPVSTGDGQAVAAPAGAAAPPRVESRGGTQALLANDRTGEPRKLDALIEGVPVGDRGVVHHLWQSTLFAVCAGLLTLGFRRNRARIRYWLWFAASIKFLIPFSIIAAGVSAMPWAPAVQAIAGSAISLATVQTTPPIVDVLSSPVASAVPAPAPGEWRLIVLIIWAGGCAGLVSRRFETWRRIRQLLAASTPVDLAQVVTLPRVHAYAAPGVLEPAVVGFLRPCLLLPVGLERHLTALQFQAVLAHEVNHIRCRDNLTAAAQMAVEAIFWFHPLVWWIGARLIAERERACDEEVLQRVEPRTYVGAIIRVCRRYVEAPIACVAGVSGSGLQKRIEAIMRNEAREPVTRSKRLLLAASTAAALAVPVGVGIMNAPAVRAQASPAQQAAMAFEVASVKRNTSANRGGMFGPQPGGRFVAINAPVSYLIRFAYEPSPWHRDLDAFQMTGGPDWLRSERFDVNAKAASEVSLAQMRRMVQALLVERFMLRVHHETRELPIYRMVVARSDGRLGPQLRRTELTCADAIDPFAGFQPGEAVPCGYFGLSPTIESVGQSNWAFRGTTMEGFARRLQSFLGRTIVDRTGLSGYYDGDFEFAAEIAIPPPPPGRPNPFEGRVFPSIFSVLPQQLGLRLESGRGPVDVLVIDSIERPTEN
jgi:uncharacterized protein (TIGR03435 family)